jgi:hypothetical protein
MNYFEEYLRTGKGLEVHANYYTEEQWEWYQLGQYDQAKCYRPFSLIEIGPIPAK